MDRSPALEAIRQGGIVPAVRVQTEKHALAALEAMLLGGIRVAEIAFSAPAANQILRSALRHFGTEIVLGAGTVLDAQTARACILDGAQFIVSPSLDLETISLCRRYSIAVLPGALTPTEIVAAWTAGADIVKVFPVTAMGGSSYIRALRGPLPQIDLMPMGGVSVESAADYLKAGAAVLGVGSDLVNVSWIAEGRTDKITTQARNYLEKIADARALSQMV